MGSHDERAGAIGGRLVDVCSSLEQEPCGLNVSMPCREQQRRESTLVDRADASAVILEHEPIARMYRDASDLRSCLDVCSVFYQRMHDLGMSAGHRPHE